MTDFSMMAGTGAKVATKVVSPFDKWSLMITSFFLLALIVSSSIESIKQDSFYPFVDGVLLRIVAPDHNIGNKVDELPTIAPLTEESKPFEIIKYYWKKYFVFWFDIILNLWFMLMLVYWINKGFENIYNASPVINWFLAIIFFALIQLIIGLAMYAPNHAGETLPLDKVAIWNDVFSESYPFEGIIKLIKHSVNGDLFKRVVDSPLKYVADVPQAIS